MKLMSDIMITKVNRKDIEAKLSVLKSDPELKEILKNIDVEMYLPELLEYVSNREKHIGCTSVATCKQETKGLRKNISRTGNYLEFTISECNCTIAEKKKKKINIEAMHLPEKLLKITGKDIFKDSERSEILKYFNNYLVNSSKEFTKGIYISGKPGMGKTMMICALANELSLREKSVIIAYFPDLVRELKSSIGEGTLEAKIKTLKNIDVLVLDDIGGEKMTEFMRDEVFGPILNSRLLSERATFFTSNLSMKELINKYSNECGKAGSLRIAERIKALSKELVLEGKKYRK